MPMNSELLALWIENKLKGTHYVAHAIWADNVKLALTEKHLRSAEDVFRRTNVVSFEMGHSYGTRGQVKVSQTMISQLDKITLPKKIIVDPNGKLTLDKAIQWRLLSKETQSKIFTTQPMPTKIFINGKPYALSSPTALVDYQISPIVSFTFHLFGEGYCISNTCDSDQEYCSDEEDYQDRENNQTTNPTYQDQFDALLKTYESDQGVKLTEHTLQVILDRNRRSTSESIDQRLSLVWDTCTHVSETKDYRSLATELVEARRTEISSNKMNETIYTLYDKIDWHYGDVAVIRANPGEIISWFNQNDKIKGNNFRTFSKGTEVELLYPFENRGDFFSLDLLDTNVIILGPQQSLAPYEGQGLQLCYIENMTEEHLNFFDVPMRLRGAKRIDHGPITTPIQPFHEIKLEPAQNPIPYCSLFKSAPNLEPQRTFSASRSLT